jgi:ribosomal protein S18 acetylase RimI-like enzyme
MQIELATLEDCRSVAEAHVESWRRAYKGILPEQYLASLSVAERESMWRGMVERQPSQLLVARIAGQIAGFVAFGASRDEGAPADCAEVWAIYVRPDFWSVGAVRHLWLAARRQIIAEGYKTVSLWVIAGNQRAIRFYESAGFVAEPESRKQFEIGGALLEEVRYVLRLMIWSLSLRAKPDYQVEYPQGYRNWTRVMSSLIGPQSPAYEKSGGLHLFYANEKAMEGYRTGKFPDGSVIVDERNKAQENAGVTRVGDRIGAAVMVKDSRRYAETGGWGFEVFRGEIPTAVLTAQGKATCYDCHAKQKDHDFVYTTIRKP